MIYRQATTFDLEALDKIHKEIFNEDNQRWFLLQINDPLYRIYLVKNKEDNEVIGYISYQVVETTADMLYFAVKKSCQGQYAGSNLLGFSMEELKKDGVKKIALEVRQTNLKARNIYKKYGFVEMWVIKNYYPEFKEDGILYVWEDQAKWLY